MIAPLRGQESAATATRCVEPGLATKEKALAQLEAPDTMIHQF